MENKTWKTESVDVSEINQSLSNPLCGELYVEEYIVSSLQNEKNPLVISSALLITSRQSHY